MIKDYDYITLYLPYASKAKRAEFAQSLSQECLDWLKENVGPGTLVYRDWMLVHDTDDYEWCYSGFEYDPATNYTTVARKFHFKDIQKATLFKLVWGG